MGVSIFKVADCTHGFLDERDKSCQIYRHNCTPESITYYNINTLNKAVAILCIANTIHVFKVKARHIISLNT